MTKNEFANSVGAEFRFSDASGVTITTCRLDALREMPTPEGFEAFALTFKGPIEPFMPQSSYCVEVEGHPSTMIFVVPIARDDSGYTYEAVFNRRT